MICGEQELLGLRKHVQPSHVRGTFGCASTSQRGGRRRGCRCLTLGEAGAAGPVTQLQVPAAAHPAVAGVPLQRRDVVNGRSRVVIAPGGAGAAA
jgi:hypothetical protein